MNRLYKFILPMPPNRANARRHHFDAYKDKKKYYAVCDIAMHGIGLYPFREEPLRRAKWKAEFFIHNASHLMDFDNLVARLKWPFDYLRDRQVIVDDDKKKFWPDCLPTQQVDNMNASRLQLTLNELE